MFTKWLKSKGKTLLSLATELEASPKSVGNWATKRTRIPVKYRDPLEGLDFPWEEYDRWFSGDQGDLALRQEISAHVENVKGYLDAMFRQAATERAALAEGLRAIAERQEELAEKLGLKPIKHRQERPK